VGVALVTGGVVVALMVAGRAAHRHPAVRSMLLATGSGIAFGMSSVFTKVVAVDWNGGVSMADVPALATIGVFATVGMLLSQAAYRGAGLAAPLATLTVVNPVVAAAVGITMFGETFRYGTTGTVLALGCGVVAAGGLILLTTERIARTEAGTGVALPEAVHAEESLVEPALAGPALDAVPAAELLGGLPEQAGTREREDIVVPDGIESILIPAQVAQEPYEDAEEPVPDHLESPNLYGPFYGGPYVPMMPVVDRHRTRVKS
ncbi:DMT family transporter, partial [Streptomyces sp. NPDC006356]